VNDDRITSRQLGQLTDGRDRPAAHAIENAARGLNAAEQAIRHTAAMIRANLGETGQRLDHGLSLNDLGELQRMPAGLDRAVTLRSTTGRSSAPCSPKPSWTPCSPPRRPPPDQPPPSLPARLHQEGTASWTAPRS
jgi:hypothetical protein